MLVLVLQVAMKAPGAKSSDSERTLNETFTVVMYGVSTYFDPRLNDSIAKLKPQNIRCLPSYAQITHLGWLLPKRKMQEAKPAIAKLLIEFDDADVANQAIILGLVLEGRDHDYQYFDDSYRLQQCFYRQTYGYIACHCWKEI